MISKTLLLILIFLGALFFSHAQCPDPTSIGTPTVVHASCPGNGSITVTSVLPAVVSPDYYQYCLYNTITNVEIYTWQNSNIFPNVNSGNYEIRVRKRCASPAVSAGYVTRAVVVNNTEVAPAISSTTLLRNSKCNNGAFSVNATGSGPLQYALVSSIGESEPVFSYVRPRQSSNKFTDLPAGTYYVRVYNVCNNAATQSIIVPAETTVSSITPVSGGFFPIGCDSLSLSVNIQNYIKNTAVFSSDASVKGWVNWPGGITDTFSIDGFTSITPGLRRHTILAHISRLDPAYNPTLAYPENLSGSSYFISYGFRDVCGNIYTNSFTYNKPTATSLFVTDATSDPSSDCDNLAHRFHISHTGGSSQHYHGFKASNNFTYSIDGGTTWQNASISNAYPTLPGSTGSVYFTIPRGATITLKVNYCGKILEKTFTATPIEALSSAIFSSDDLSCVNTGRIRIQRRNIVGTRAGIQMLTAPAGQSIVPYFEFTPEVNSSAYNYPAQLSNLLPGTYTFTVWDTIGVDCPRNRTYTVNNTAYNFDFTYSVLCNGNLEINANTPVASVAGYVKVKIFNSSGTQVVGGANGISGTTTTYVTVPASLTSSLPDGIYTIRLGRYLNNPSLDNCSYIEKTWNKSITNNLNLNPSIFFSGCPDSTGALVASAGGGTAPYAYTLYDNANNPVAPTVVNGNTFNNLNTSQTYRLNVIDQCGAIVNRTLSSNSAIGISTPGYSTMPCIGQTINLHMPNFPGMSYVWYKDSVLIPSATSSVFTLSNLVAGDAGDYQSTLTVGSCAISKSIEIDPTACGGPLAVDLVSFNVTCDKEGNSLVNWMTASEFNAMDFTLSKSRDLKNWEVVEIIPAAGHSNHLISYASRDEKTFSGTSYYQLMQRDFDGKETKYNPISFSCSQTGESSGSLYPNPSTGSFQFDFTADKAGILEMQVVDMNGKPISSQENTMERGSNSFTFSQHLTTGIYFVKITVNKVQRMPIKLVVL